MYSTANNNSHSNFHWAKPKKWQNRRNWAYCQHKTSIQECSFFAPALLVHCHWSPTFFTKHLPKKKLVTKSVIPWCYEISLLLSSPKQQKRWDESFDKKRNLVNSENGQIWRDFFNLISNDGKVRKNYEFELLQLMPAH